MRRCMPVAEPSLLSASRTEQAATSGRWLSIVGIGEDGVAGLSATARELVSAAAFVFGGKRHLALAASLITGSSRPWPSPFADALPQIMALRGEAVCVLASGDPFMHGIGSVLGRHIPVAEMIVVPAPSAFSLAAARLCWSLPETVLLSLHGRPLDLIRPYLQPGARLLVLTSGSDAPAALANLLHTNGFGPSRMVILEALGAAGERIRDATADSFGLDGVAPLNTVAITIAVGPGARVIPVAGGIDDALFEHDGQITKREIRALSLSSLAPRRGERLWDIGAGSGSVAIEWMLADPSLQAIAVERRSDRAARIRRNAAMFGVPHLSVIEGAAPAALGDLPTPDAAFIGGGARAAGLIEAVCATIRPGGRLVVNAVTVATEALLLAKQAELGGDLTRIAITRAGPVGSAANGPLGWQPARPVTQWVWIKP